ncbi:MAG: putative nitrogen fixation protein NifT [Oceanobacter sp.]
MPTVMLRENDGELTLYIPKKDLEDVIVSVEFDGDEGWGGELTLGDGSSYIIDKLDTKPDLPISIRAKRGVEA